MKLLSKVSELFSARSSRSEPLVGARTSSDPQPPSHNALPPTHNGPSFTLTEPLAHHAPITDAPPAPSLEHIEREEAPHPSQDRSPNDLSAAQHADSLDRPLYHEPPHSDQPNPQGGEARDESQGSRDRVHASRRNSVEDWRLASNHYPEEFVPQTEMFLPTYQPSRPVEEMTIAPPSHDDLINPSRELNRASRQRRSRRSLEVSAPPPPQLHLFTCHYEEALPPPPLERLLAPVHVPSLSEVALMMRQWLSLQVKESYEREESLSTEEVEDIRHTWLTYFTLRPDDMASKLEYGCFLLDFYGKSQAHHYLWEQYLSSSTPEPFLFAVTSLAHTTGDSTGAYELMSLLYEALPYDCQVLELKLDIERSIGRLAEARDTERTLYHQQLLSEGATRGY